jgi:kynureninase
MADGLFRTMGASHELRIVDPDAVSDAIDESVAVVLLTEVDYRTGRRHDMAALTAAAHAAGALTVWDLAHSAGALDVDLAGCDADFAVGCTYKYLNGGPGSPGFIFVSEALIEEVRPALSGWLGHEAPFAFDLDFRPDPGIGRMRIGTPPVLALAALDVALDAWEGVEMADVWARSIELSERLIAGVEASCPTLELASPRNPDNRGSQVAFRHPEGYAVMQALIARGVIGDFRAPDLIRFGITPLYLEEADIDRAVEILIEIMASDAWDTPEYRKRKAVT